MKEFCFEITQGTDRAYQFGALDAIGKQCSFFGFSAVMQIKDSPFSIEPVDHLTTENGRIVLDETGHYFRVTLPREKTKTYPAGVLVYDLKIISDSGEASVLISGEIHVNQGISDVA